jgi:hypothetical protein
MSGVRQSHLSSFGDSARAQPPRVHQKWLRNPEVHERLDALAFDAFCERLVIAHAVRPLLGVTDTRARSDQERGRHPRGMGDTKSERHAPTHRIPDQMSGVQIQFVEDRCKLADTRRHRVGGGISGRRAAPMTDEVEGERPMGIAQSPC